MLCIAGLCRRQMSVYLSICLSVCPSYASIPLKWLNISLDFFHRLLATPFWFFRAMWYGNSPVGTLMGGTKCSGIKNRAFRSVSRFISEMIQDRAIVTNSNIRKLPIFIP